MLSSMPDWKTTDRVPLGLIGHFGDFNYFFHVIDVILLIFNNLFIWLNLGFSPIFVCFNLDIFTLNSFVIFVQLD